MHSYFTYACLNVLEIKKKTESNKYGSKKTYRISMKTGQMISRKFIHINS